MIFIQIVFMALTLSGLCAFTLMTAHRTGFLEWLQGNVPRGILYSLVTCNFCLGFWLSVFFATLAFTLWVPFTWPMVLVPLVATAFNNTLLK